MAAPAFGSTECMELASSRGWRGVPRVTIGPCEVEGGWPMVGVSLRVGLRGREESPEGVMRGVGVHLSAQDAVSGAVGRKGWPEGVAGRGSGDERRRGRGL